MKISKLFSVMALAVIITLTLSACGSDAFTKTSAPPVGMPQPSGVPAAGSESEIDFLFIDMMVPHHQGAVEMAKIAQARAEHPEVKQMADAIINSQEAEITQMKTWKQEWYGTSETPPMSAMPMLEAMEGMGGMGHPMDMQADVESLRVAAEPFDLAFIDAMIPHHQSAIDAAKVVLKTAQHAEIRTLAQQIIDAQQQEIDQMNAWWQAWYPDSPAPSTH